MRWLLAAFLAAVALSLPFTNVPVIDDWAYAFSVEELLSSGRFRILDYSCRYNLAQVLWGSLFSLPSGFSFVALRLSTVALLIPGLLAFHDLLRRRTSESVALWTTALLAFNPVFFRLSLSFMTDVPLIASVAIAFWLFERGIRLERASWRVAGMLVAVAAYLVRELAIVAPAALLCAALVRDPRSKPATIGALALLAAAGFALEFWWISSVQGSTTGLALRTGGLRYVLDVPPSLYVGALLRMLLTTAAFAAPLALASLRRNDWGWVIAVGGSVAIAALLADAVPFGRSEVLSPLGLGMSRALLPGEAQLASVGQLMRAFALAAGAASLALLARELIELARRGWKRCEALDAMWMAFGVGAAGALLVLWLWQDRYDLVLLPSALWLAALRVQRLSWNRPGLQVAVACFALLGVLGTRDDFELNRAAWRAEAALREAGVAAADIDGGYVLNGWRLYAHVERFAPSFPAERVPFLFAKDELPYVLSTTQLEASEVVREYEWSRTWLSEPRLFALRRAATSRR